MSDPELEYQLNCNLTLHHPNPSELIYPTDIEGQQYTNVLLIDKSVQEYQQFIDSVNADTFPIVYSSMSSKTDLLALLKTKFTSISRLGLVFHSSSSGDSITFLDREPLFVPDEVSANQQFIKDIINEFQIKNIDYLACDTLNYPNWTNYYDNISQDTGVIIGASNDKTGNIKYGGDWVLETTSENVELIYFTKSIEYYQYLLDVFTVAGIVYTTNPDNTTCYVSGYTGGLSGTTTIPGTVINIYNGITYTVTSIGGGAFNNCSALTTISMPNVTSIVREAFYNCSALTSIVIPGGVTSIGYYAFEACYKLTSIIFINQHNLQTAEGMFYNGANILVTSINSVTYYNTSGFGNLSTASLNLQNQLNSLTPSYIYIPNPPPPPPTITNISPVSGSTLGGTSVTISGTNLTGVTSVTFGGTNATNVSATSTSITCIAPAGTAGPANVVVTTPGGNVTSSNAFTYTVAPVSNICFPAGTLITCNQGEIPIDKLNPEIHTIRGKKIVGITKTVTQDKHLVCFEKDALQENIPSQKTMITQNHKIFYKGEMMRAKDFVNDFENVKKIKYTGEVLYNVLMEQPDKMMVNNLICETLHPENSIAKLYKALTNLNAEQQNEVIIKFNKCVIENNIYNKKNNPNKNIFIK